MIRRTHLAGGLLASAIMYNNSYTAIPYVVLGTAVSLFGSLIPDIDTPTSALGKKLPSRKKTIIDKRGKKREVKTDNIVSIIFKHRTFTHSILFILMNYVLVESLVDYMLIEHAINISWLYAYIYGIISHVALDLLNYQGIALLYPLPDKFSLPIIRIKSGGGGDMFVGILCITMSLGLFMNPGALMGMMPAIQSWWNTSLHKLKMGEG